MLYVSNQPILIFNFQSSSYQIVFTRLVNPIPEQIHLKKWKSGSAGNQTRNIMVPVNCADHSATEAVSERLIFVKNLSNNNLSS